METKQRLIDANKLLEKAEWYIDYNPHIGVHEFYHVYVAYIEDAPTVDAVPIDDIKLHHILIDKNGIPEVKLQFGERTIILRREGDPVDVRVFVNGQWRMVYDDSAGWVNECSKCKEFGDGTPYCPNCGAKMDGEQNG